MFKILLLLLSVCLIDISLQAGKYLRNIHILFIFSQIYLNLGFIKVNWGGNEVFLSTDQELELEVATVNLSLTCSFSTSDIMWQNPSGDRISLTVNNVIEIGILRLAESGAFTCTHKVTLECVKIQIIPTGML